MNIKQKLTWAFASIACFPVVSITELVALTDQSIPLGMVIATWKFPGAKGNRMVVEVEEALMLLA